MLFSEKEHCSKKGKNLLHRLHLDSEHKETIESLINGSSETKLKHPLTAFAAFRQGVEALLCSGGFDWGYSDKVPDATGKKAGVELVFQCLYKGGGRSPHAVGLKESAVKEGFFLWVESIYRGGIGAAEQTGAESGLEAIHGFYK